MSELGVVALTAQGMGERGSVGGVVDVGVPGIQGQPWPLRPCLQNKTKLGPLNVLTL